MLLHLLDHITDSSRMILLSICLTAYRQVRQANNTNRGILRFADNVLIHDLTYPLMRVFSSEFDSETVGYGTICLDLLVPDIKYHQLHVDSIHLLLFLLSETTFPDSLLFELGFSHAMVTEVMLQG